MPTIIEPGTWVDGLGELIYHGDPIVGGSLSYSGAKALLDCPAKFDHDRQHGRPPKAVFDFGHLAHGLVLGTGLDIDVVHYSDWRTKDAQARRKAAYDRGAVPVLSEDYSKAEAMAGAVQRHPIASVLFDRGVPERSLFWTDERTGQTLRARPDWLRPAEGDVPCLVVDYKTTTDASPRTLRSTVARLHYEQQDAWYRQGVRALGIDEAPRFVFVFQEKDAPYVVTVVELDEEARQVGERRNAAAVDLFRECERTGSWPGYADTDIVSLSLPGWATYIDDEEQRA